MIPIEFWNSIRFGFFVKWHINFCRLFNAKAILLEEQKWYCLTHSWEDKGVYAFTQGYLSENEHSRATGVWTCLQWFRSPAIWPLHLEDKAQDEI